MLKQLLIALTIIIIATPALFGAKALTGEEILKKSDAEWVPQNCSYTITMKTLQDGSEKEDVYKGYKKGASKNVMVVQKPVRISGSVFLRKDNVIWSYFTTNQKLAKVAFQSLFMGSLLSYGDILATELSYDYKVDKLEEIQDEYVLTLKPKEGESGYGKVVLTINKTTLLPKKRDYFALSGILLKTCVFNKIEMKGRTPVLIEQEYLEPLKERKTVITLSNITLMGDIPEKYYNENFLQHMGAQK